jgi:hypothetical protein
MTIPTVAGQTAEQIASSIFQAFSAPESPFPLSCPEENNPRDMVLEGDSVVTILPTALRVCIMDPGIGVVFGPHGTEIPLPEDPVVPYGDIALLGTEILHIGQRTVVEREGGLSLVANSGTGSTDLTHDVEVGDVQSIASILLDGSIVHGSASSSGSVTLQNGATVAGEVVEEATLALPGLDPFAVTFPATNQGPIALEPDEEQTLAPGAWGTVSVKSRSVLRLSSGTYFFNTLQVLEPQAVFELDQSGGPITIYVRDEFTYRGSTITAGGEVPDLLLVYTGTAQAFIEAPFRGTAVAPNAQLSLQANNGQLHQGAFFARHLRLEPDAVVEHVPFSQLPGATANESCGDGELNQDETDVDCGSVCGATCAPGQVCNLGTDCSSGACMGGICEEPAPGGTCTAATAIDIGPPSNPVSVDNGACLRVFDGFPSWWGTRNLQLQSQANNALPIGYTWSSVCSGAAGSGVFVQDWQSEILSGISDGCPLVIELQGGGGGSANLVYYAN